MSDGGKGSGRRNEDVSKVRSNWDQIDWGKKMTNDEMIDEDDDAIPCVVCGGDMVLAGHKLYVFCEQCGHREELTDDDYT